MSALVMKTFAVGSRIIEVRLTEVAGGARSAQAFADGLPITSRFVYEQHMRNELANQCGASAAKEMAVSAEAEARRRLAH